MNPILLFGLGVLTGIIVFAIILWFWADGTSSSEANKPSESPSRPTLPSFPPGIVPQGEHILVVDDDPELADQVAACLCEVGYTVETVHSAEEAWISLRLKLPVLVVTDDVMPGADGWELKCCIRRAERLSELPIICLGEKEPERITFGYSNIGFDMELTKPFDCEELVHFVRRILQTSSEGDGRYQI